MAPVKLSCRSFAHEGCDHSLERILTQAAARLLKVSRKLFY